MTAQKSWRKRFTSLLAAGAASLVAVSGIALAPTAANAADDRAVTGGTASWGLSTQLNSSNMGRPNPSPENYVAPAVFDDASRISTWGSGSGTLNADGSASLSFSGKSVNHAKTGGGWLTIADPQVVLDADGNGTVSAVVAYGTAAPPATFDPNQTPVRGAERVNIVSLQGNDIDVQVAANVATWDDVEGIWHDDFLAFLGGDAAADPAIAAWSYAAFVTNAGLGENPTTTQTERLASPFTFSVNLEPVADPQITVTPNSNLDPAVENTLTVSGTGFVGPAAVNGAYVVFGEKSVWSGNGPLPSSGWIAMEWIMPNQISNGSFTRTLTIPANTLDSSKSYHVGTSAAHALSATNRTLDSFQDVTVKQTAAPLVFTDVKKSDKFYNQISWMAAEGLSTGYKQPNGTRKFLPKENVSREAMVAFLYRLEGSPAVTLPAKSPFTDVKKTDKFYKEIIWAYQNKVTTGTKQSNGTRKFEPKAAITREAMSAFMYRVYGDELTATGGKNFKDVPKSHKFYNEIRWMSANGITTGNADGTFKPKGKTSREATAAFLYRAENR